MNIAALKGRIRHYLRQNSEVWNSAIQSNAPEPTVKSLALDLDAKTKIGRRRLEKYFNPGLSDKELTITLQDLEAFSKIQGMTLGSFINYLLENNDCYSEGNQLTSWQIQMLSFFSGVHHALRRELNSTVFSGQKSGKSEAILALLVKVYTFENEDFKALCRLVDTIHATSRKH